VWTWSRIAARCYRDFSEGHLDHGDPAGYLPLREAVARYLATARMVRCRPEQVIITNGSQQALDLVARVLVSPGEAVWLEDPGSMSAQSVFRSAGARLIPVRVDAEGMVVSEGLRAAPDACLAHVTPSHHYPLGMPLGPSRCLALLQWASRSGAWIVEHDRESAFRFAGLPVPSLREYDAKSRTLVVGSFRTTMFPDLRLGYLVAPDELLDRLLAARFSAGAHAATMPQVILAEFIAGGYYASHVRRTRTVYARRRAALAEALRRDLGGRAGVEVPPGGLRLIVRLPAKLDDREISALAADRGLEVSPLSAHRELPGDPALLLGFACDDEGALRAGSGCLARVLDAAPKARRGAEVDRLTESVEEGRRRS
jgi:GntR family transcriptional regulator/MocR family aminotransferase